MISSNLGFSFLYLFGIYDFFRVDLAGKVCCFWMRDGVDFELAHKNS